MSANHRPVIVLAFDKFRDSIDASRARRAATEGVCAARPDARVLEIPCSDGGEGWEEIPSLRDGAQRMEADARDPLGRCIRAGYARDGDGAAWIAMSAASGLALLNPAERDPLKTTTAGTGDLIAHAATRGASRILLGLGGSATCDGGAGMAGALGYRFLDRQGRELPPGGGNLVRLARIDPEGFARRGYREALHVRTAADVDNPLLGPHGAARVYAPQKGADAEGVERLEEGLHRLAERAAQDLGIEAAERPGAGAAGGMGAGCAIFLDAAPEPGFDIAAAEAGLDRALARADLVLTGEGRLDAQTARGKVVAGVASRARAHGVPCVVLAGRIDDPAAAAREHNLRDATALAVPGEPLEVSLAAAEDRLRQAVREGLAGWLEEPGR